MICNYKLLLEGVAVLIKLFLLDPLQMARISLDLNQLFQPSGYIIRAVKTFGHVETGCTRIRVTN